VDLTRGPDGRWTALDARAIYQLYQAHLRAEGSVLASAGSGGPIVNGAADRR
jgi:hypothetical protein